MPNRCLTPISFLQEFYSEAEIKKDIIINVKNDFFVQPFLGGPHRTKLPSVASKATLQPTLQAKTAPTSAAATTTRAS